jgi:superfamily II helicase
MDQRGWRIIIFSSIALLLAAACYPAIYSMYTSAAGDGGADNIQLLYFHRTQRCQSCNNAEQYARETLDRYFADDLRSGKITMQSIDYQKDKAMADKYNVNMQGLKMVTTCNGQQTVKDVPEVWALVRDKEACISCLKGVIDKEMGK